MILHQLQHFFENRDRAYLQEIENEVDDILDGRADGQGEEDEGRDPPASAPR